MTEVFFPETISKSLIAWTGILFIDNIISFTLIPRAYALLFFLILIIFSSTTFANDRLKGYQALEDQDYKKALYYLSYEANLGDDKAQYNLGIMYKKGLGVPVNNNEAFGWFFCLLIRVTF